MRHRAMLYCTKLDQSVLHFPDVFTDSDVPQGNSSHEFLVFLPFFFFVFYVIPVCTPSSGGHTFRILQFLFKLVQNVSKK